jgi:type IV secretion system protein TrbB
VTEHTGTVERQLEKLRRDFGDVFLAALADRETVEILLNPDGTLWQERLGGAPMQIGSMARTKAESVLRTIAACLQTTITREKPTIECELPLDGSRFAGQMPPVVPAPTFAVRKRASRVFTLEQYVQAGILTPEEKEFLCEAIRDHRNILATGSTGSGKTTLVNALIREVTAQYPSERLIIIEDTSAPEKHIVPAPHPTSLRSRSRAPFAPPHPLCAQYAQARLQPPLSAARSGAARSGAC